MYKVSINLYIAIIVQLTSTQKQVSIELVEAMVASGQELHGRIILNYSGRFDSLVINSQIENSNDVFSYVNLNGKKINHPYARLSIFKAELGGRNPVEFIAVTKHVPPSDYSAVKFRASIIQEHKEVVSDLAYIKVVKP
jgi:hypothetical protein